MIYLSPQLSHATHLYEVILHCFGLVWLHHRQVTY